MREFGFELFDGVRPSHRFGIPISFFEVAHEDSLDFISVLEIVRRQDVALHMRKDNLDLIQPGRMDRQPVDLDPERQVQAFDPFFDLFGRMRGAVVENQMQDADLLAPETAEEHLEEGLEITEALSIETTRQSFAAIDQQRREQLDRSLALIAIADQGRASRTRRSGAAYSLASLKGGLFIGAHDDMTDGRQLLSPFVEPQDGNGLFQKLGIGRFLPASELPGFDVFSAQPAPNGGGRDA